MEDLGVDTNALSPPFRCACLQELVLTENYINALPSSIGNLTRLTNLNIDRNRLEALPADVGRLVNLGVFSLRENQLHSLPHEIGTCEELHVLDVSGNRLPHLPFTLTNLNLKALWLAENQAKPMLNFQTDYDENTGEQVLTCFLLPQDECQNEENAGESVGRYNRRVSGLARGQPLIRSTWVSGRRTGYPSMSVAIQLKVIKVNFLPSSYVSTIAFHATIAGALYHHYRVMMFIRPECFSSSTSYHVRQSERAPRPVLPPNLVSFLILLRCRDP